MALPRPQLIGRKVKARPLTRRELGQKELPKFPTKKKAIGRLLRKGERQKRQILAGKRPGLLDRPAFTTGKKRKPGIFKRVISKVRKII